MSPQLVLVILIGATLTTAGCAGVQAADDEAGAALVSAPYKVFVTSRVHSGNFGGLVGADAFCQQHATAAGLAGTYKAWLSSSSLSASGRLFHSTVPYTKVDGTMIARNWPDLTDGSLLSLIDKTETGATVPTSTMVWTSTCADGSSCVYDGDCEGWTQDYPSWAIWGATNPNYDTWVGWNDAYWTSFGTGVCFLPGALYCFQQPSSLPSPSSAPSH
jgi:hypothetical protein